MFYAVLDGCCQGKAAIGTVSCMLCPPGELFGAFERPDSTKFLHFFVRSAPLDWAKVEASDLTLTTPGYTCRCQGKWQPSPTRTKSRIAKAHIGCNSQKLQRGMGNQTQMSRLGVHIRRAANLGSSTLRALSAPVTGRPAGLSNPTCTRTPAWSQ